MARNPRASGKSTVREVAEIKQLLRDLEVRVEHLTGSSAAQARAVSGAMPDVINIALTAVAERFRDVVQDRARDAGEEAARVGTDAWKKIEQEISHRPFAILAAAAGIGFLVGLLGREK